MATQINTNVPSGSGSGSDTIDFANLGPYLLTRFITVLEAAAIIIIGIFLIRYAKIYLNKLTIVHAQQKTALNLLEKLFTGFIIVISITLALKTIGLDMTLLVSVLILGLSYGLQDIIKNYVAGILIMFKSPFKIGDLINIKGQTGKVETIDFQATTLRTADQKHVTIYNSDVMTQSITNYSHTTIRRIDIDITLGYGSDNLQAFKIFDRILESHPSVVKKPAHKIVFKQFSTTGVQFSIRAWVNFPSNVMAIKSDIALQISQAFDEEKIYIPFEKTIQIESDYSMTDARKAKIAEMHKNPIYADDLSVGFPPAGELIDFDEIE
jgi:small conductance mechanosensitive channel